MNKKFFTILLTLLPLLASAEAVKIDGIWYNLVSKAKEAEVTRGNYTGDLAIPPTVNYDEIEYKVTSIGESAFSSSEITSVSIPSSVKRIGNHSFSSCHNLTSIVIPEGVETIGYEAFSGCSNVVELILPNSLKTIEYAAFAYLGITTVKIPNSISGLSGTFYGCEKLTSIVIPNGVGGLEDTFYNCSKLASVTLPESLEIIGRSTFYNCSSLKDIEIPNSVNDINNEAFYGCTSLTTIIIPNDVKNIGTCAFKGCKGLTSITIGKGGIFIDDEAFANCTELTDVYCMAEELSDDVGLTFTDGLITYSTAFNGSYIEYATLHIPESAINAYKTTYPWSKFGKIITFSSEEMETKKCATPTISFENGIVKFNCETEDVKFVSKISTTDTKKYYDSELTLTYKYKVTVYATKNGYENSDNVTAEFTSIGKLGDLNGDGKVNVADHVKLSEIIMSEE